MNCLKYFEDFFLDYSKSFIEFNSNTELLENIELKRVHSLNVYKNSFAIASSITKDKEKILIAALCGLFHDIGRFIQFTEYKTFRDENGIYHGALGVKVLSEKKILEKLPNSKRNLILNAVYDHGLKEIPKEHDNEQMFYSRITRDADKLDIYRLVSEYYHSKGPRNIALEYGLSDNEIISDKVWENFHSKESIDKNDLRTLDDFKIMQLAWIFDINFNHTIKKISENKYIPAILNSLKSKKRKADVSKILSAYCRNVHNFDIFVENK